MKVLHAPKSLILSSAALFVLVPLAVLTAAIFSSHVWWDLPMAHLQTVGFLALLIVAPASWRLMMGRSGTWSSLAALLVVVSLGLFLRAAWTAITLQALWAIVFMASCTALLAWTRLEQTRSYFDPGMRWYQGLPESIPGIRCSVVGGVDSTSVLTVARLDRKGLFAFAREGRPQYRGPVLLELSWGERKIRLEGRVVRHFEDRISGRGASEAGATDWGMGVQFESLSPDMAKELDDFIEVIRGEGYID